jgi:transposase
MAGKLLLQGMSISDVADVVEASTSSVGRWKQIVELEGLDGLNAKPVPGRPPRLSSADRKQLEELLRKGPREAGLTTDAWTCPRVVRLIQQQFGVEFHPDHVRRILDALGWSCQRPEQRARERDEASIVRWREKEWPRIKKGASTSS